MKRMVPMVAALALIAGCATLTEEERVQARVEWEACIDAAAPEILGFMLLMSNMSADFTAELGTQIAAHTSVLLHEMAVERCGTGHLDEQTRSRYLVAELVRLMIEHEAELVEQQAPLEP